MTKITPQSPIVILSGAGISADSGLKTFRDSDGLWENHRVEDVATPEAFAKNPVLVHQFYNERRAQLLSDAVRPNAAHLALAELEKKWTAPVLVITQNVDNLHERAGSKNVIHMHGELTKVRCQNSGQVFEWTENLTDKTKCTCCKWEGSLRPHIVWFGEIPLDMEEIEEALYYCRLFLVIGTSAQVYPAAGFIHTVKAEEQAYTVEFNREKTAASEYFDENIFGSASETLPPFIQELLKQ